MSSSSSLSSYAAADELPMKPIPGSYGVPVFSSLIDRLQLNYGSGGPEGFFQSRILRHGGSTVLRVNNSPGVFLTSDPRVVAVLDAKSFPVLFDTAKVDKTDILTGPFVSSKTLTGLTFTYLDPSDPRHGQLKQIIIDLLVARKDHFIPAFRSIYSSIFDDMETQLLAGNSKSKSKSSSFTKPNNAAAFDFLIRAMFGTNPSAVQLGATGTAHVTKLFLFLFSPILNLGLPAVLEELLLHSIRYPTFLSRPHYDALYAEFTSAAAEVLDEAEKNRGISRDEGCRNILFVTLFNAYAGVRPLLPTVIKWVAAAGPELHARLAKEIRAEVEAEGGAVTLAAIERMQLTKSVVWEVMRIDPVVKFQFARARKDIVVESHEGRYSVKKGEMICGYQPMATKDPKVFDRAGEFVGDRFVGEEGKKLLRYVLWSNGPETENPAAGNKQCPGKHVGVLIGRMLLVELFLHYDTFAVEVEAGGGVAFTSITPKQQA